MSSEQVQANIDARRARRGWALWGVTALFLALAGAFLGDLWGRPAQIPRYALVDTNFLSTATVRQSYANRAAAGDDISGFDCYACHDKAKPVAIKYDENHK